eukprot:GHVQ01021273.1.p1 GENE.GHVQ01021273.1~~GHVQ01021273.1.p1  ORF type:complete len:113 (+),score=3.29 GHVQ01021273.1:134-472(+)
MAARNPGPYLNQCPIGFPPYKRLCGRDWTARRLFEDHEVSTRIYKNCMDNLGVKVPIVINKKVGVTRIKLRCIQGGYGRGIYRWTRMARMQFFQTQREGWLRKYGLRSKLFR